MNIHQNNKRKSHEKVHKMATEENTVGVSCPTRPCSRIDTNRGSRGEHGQGMLYNTAVFSHKRNSNKNREEHGPPVFINSTVLLHRLRKLLFSLFQTSSKFFNLLPLILLTNLTLTWLATPRLWAMVSLTKLSQHHNSHNTQNSPKISKIHQNTN